VRTGRQKVLALFAGLRERINRVVVRFSAAGDSTMTLFVDDRRARYATSTAVRCRAIAVRVHPF
jgi:hypothetical protein